MHTRCGTTIVFNGEIYNYRELRRRCSDFEFRSESDTELILALYEKLGVECFKHLNGMFALAIWDPQQHLLTLARDRIGKKPLYYHLCNDTVLFSSEIRSLLCWSTLKAQLDKKALYEFLTFGLVPTPRTMFEGITKLPPGSQLCIPASGNPAIQRFWEIDYQDVPEQEEELCDLLRRSLETSVNYRLVSDVPVGAFLSGGVDSSAIVALMQRNLGYRVNTFSIGFEGQPEYDELHCARAVAERFDTEHHEYVLSRRDIATFLPKVVEIFDEPLADPTCVPIFFLAKMARERGIKVVLNGDGPDELMLGYRSWVKYARLFPWYRRYARLPGIFKNGVLSVAKLLGETPNTEIWHRAANNQEFFWGGARAFKEWNKRQFLSDSYLHEVRDITCHSTIQSFREEFAASAVKRPNAGSDDINWMSYLGLKHLIPNFYALRADRLCMRHSVEARSPFLDYNFANLALSIPHRWKIKNGTPKYILKKALRPLLPASVLDRKKQGFCVPIREWGVDVIADTIEDKLPGFCSRHGVFDEPVVRKQVRHLRNGDRCNVPALWTTCFLLSWVESWIR